MTGSARVSARPLSSETTARSRYGWAVGYVEALFYVKDALLGCSFVLCYRNGNRKSIGRNGEAAVLLTGTGAKVQSSRRLCDPPPPPVNTGLPVQLLVQRLVLRGVPRFPVHV